MDTLSHEELIEQLDMIIMSLEANEEMYYVVLDLVHQAREELNQFSPGDDDEDE